MRLKNKEQKVDNINCWGYVICLTLSTGIILLNYWSYHFEKTILTCIMIILINKKNCFFTFIRVVIEILCHDHLHPNPSFLKLLPYVLSLYSGAASAPDFESAAYGSVLYFLEAVLPFLETFYRDFYYPDQSTYSNEIDETDHIAKAVVVCSISRGRNIHCIFNAIILILNIEIPVFCDLPREHLNRVI